MPVRDSYEPGRPSWVDLGTSDLDAARRFYSDLFGWTPEASDDPQAGGYTQFLYDSHAVAGVGPLFDPNMPVTWTTYIATADADATAKEAAANGGTVITEPFDVMDVGRMAILAAPDGAVFGIWQARSHKGAGFVNEPVSWNWSQLMTRDKPAALAFYGAVFGWEERSSPEWGEYIALGDGEIASAQQIGPELPAEVPSHWQTWFSVADAEVTADKAVDLGGSRMGSAWEMGPGAKVVPLADPQGATFSVLSMPAQS